MVAAWGKFVGAQITLSEKAENHTLLPKCGLDLLTI
jgi:hypothetical protein